MVEASFRGGARIGWVNATWPLATLTVRRDELRLSGLGLHTFSPRQIVSLQPHGSIPLFEIKSLLSVLQLASGFLSLVFAVLLFGG